MTGQERPGDDLDALSLDGSVAPPVLGELDAIVSRSPAPLPSGASPRRRLSSTAAVAAMVTAIVMAPLLVLSIGAGAAVPDAGIVLVDGARTRGLAGARLATGTEPAVRVEIDDALAVAWTLAAPDVGRADAIDGGTDRSGPDFALDTVGRAVATLEPGLYDLLVVATLRTGTTVRRAARFEVVDAP